jgi:hypothetical protein
MTVTSVLMTVIFNSRHCLRSNLGAPTVHGGDSLPAPASLVPERVPRELVRPLRRLHDNGLRRGESARAYHLRSSCVQLSTQETASVRRRDEIELRPAGVVT